LNGEPYFGDSYGAGEIGHLVVEPGGERCSCGNDGCLEAVGSAKAIVERAQNLVHRFPNSKLNDNLPLSWAGLLAALAAGDEVAVQHIQEAGRFLGMAIANLIATLNIRLIVISGRVYQLGQIYLESALAEAQCRALPSMVSTTEVRFSNLGLDVVILGSSAMVLKHELGVI
jgi:glucokinase